MQINKSLLGGVAATSAAANSPVTSKGSQSSAIDAVSAVRRTDQVEISDAARSLIEQHQAKSLEESVGGRPLDSTRLDEIRGKLSAGVYGLPEIADHVARAILNRGDV